MINHIGSTIAGLDWDTFVHTMHEGFDGSGQATKMAIGIGVLVLVLINIWVARWLSKFSVHRDR